jgi:hypothetical protein
MSYCSGSLRLLPKLAIILLTGATLLYLFGIGTSPIHNDGSSAYAFGINSRLQSSTIRLDRILNVIARDIQGSIDKYDEEMYRNELGIQLRNTTISGYAQDMRIAYGIFFSTSSRELLDTAISYLHLLPNPVTAIPIEKTIYTTDLLPPEGLPEQFKTWTINNPGWTVRFTNDEDMDQWLISAFGEESGVVREMKWLKRRGVVRADLFRLVTHVW